MAGQHAGVVHAVAAARAQFRRDPDRPQPRADEGLPPACPRAGATAVPAGGRGTGGGAGGNVKAPAVSGIGARLGAGDGYRKLAYATAAMAFLLIVVGGIVRVSDSGLGCGAKGSGTQGWPLCGGRVVPIVDTHMVVEYTHRFLAATVTAMVASLALFAWRRQRANRALVRTSIAAFVLIIVQASLGGLTVEKGLKEELVATHLGVAMLQIGLILLIARLSRPVEERRPASERPGTTRAIRT